MANGKIVQITGPVVDVAFPEGDLPEIKTALLTTNTSLGKTEWNLTLEVAQHLGENRNGCAVKGGIHGVFHLRGGILV